MGQGRAIDHVGIATRNLDGLAAKWENLGFTLTPRAYHQDHMGTSNRLVQFEGNNFIELLEVDRPKKMLPHGPDFMGFGQFNHDFLKKREGMSLIVFRTDDAAADLARRKAQGLETYDQFNFERQATLPDGSEQTVRFELGFVTSPLMPDTLFYVCDNKAEEHFWKPEFQEHDNSAEEIEAIIFCSSEPALHADFLARLFDGETIVEDDKVTVQCGPHDIVVTTPPELSWTGWDLDPGRNAVAAGLEIAAPDRESEVIKPAGAGGVYLRFT